MSDLKEFVGSIVEQGKNGNNELKELQDILEKLSTKPKMVYRSYDVVSNI